MNQPNQEKLASALVGGTPMAYKSYPDGSLVVIAPDGRKFRFNSKEVEGAKAKLVSPPSSKKPSSSSRTKKPTPPSPANSDKDEEKKISSKP